MLASALAQLTSQNSSCSEEADKKFVPPTRGGLWVLFGKGKAGIGNAFTLSFARGVWCRARSPSVFPFWKIYEHLRKSIPYWERMVFPPLSNEFIRGMKEEVVVGRLFPKTQQNTSYASGA